MNRDEHDQHGTVPTSVYKGKKIEANKLPSWWAQLGHCRGCGTGLFLINGFLQVCHDRVRAKLGLTTSMEWNQPNPAAAWLIQPEFSTHWITPGLSIAMCFLNCLNHFHVQQVFESFCNFDP